MEIENSWPQIKNSQPLNCSKFKCPGEESNYKHKALTSLTN